MTAPRVTEIALFTADVDTLTAFYERVLGVAPDERSPRHAVFTLGEVVLLIHVKVDPTPGGPPGEDHVAFSLEALDDRAASLAEAGIAVDGPLDLPWGRSAYLRDPDGRVVELA